MPIYEYECVKCGHQAEVWQKITERSVSKCELCKSKMKKLISQSTFHLKGSGWYVTDYAGKNNGLSESKKESGSKETKSKEAKSTDKKPKKEASSAGSKK